MAKHHGRHSVFTVGGVALIGIENIEVNKEKDQADTTSMGDDWETSVTGMRRATITVSGRWDNTVTTGNDTVLKAAYADDDPVAIEYGPIGDDTGDPKASGDAHCTQYNRTSPLGDVVAYSAEFKVDGELAEGTFA